MPSQSEKSFGARLRKLQDAVEFIRGWKDYQPSRTEESLAELELFLSKVKAANEIETQKQVGYLNAVSARKAHFTKEATSVDKLLTSIRGAVESQFGKKSAPATQVSAIITTMRKSELIKLPADPTNPSVQEQVSQSEQSYGSRTQYFTDIVTTLAATPGYTSSNPAISVAGLQEKVAELNKANDQVAQSLQQISSSRGSRMEQYNELAERSKRIKAYTKSQYGIRSSEYKSLIALGI